MANLIINGGFDNSNITVAPWTQGTFTDGSLNVLNGTFQSSPNSAGLLGTTNSLLQTNIPTIIGQSYRLTFYSISVLGSGAGQGFNVQVNSDPAVPFVTQGANTFAGVPQSQLIFVADTTTTSIEFLRPVNNGTSIAIDTVVLVQVAICYTGDSLVYSKNIVSGEISSVPVSEIKSTSHLVFSTEKNKFVPIIHNIVSGPYTEFVILKKNVIADNIPNKDLYITSGHVVVIDNKEIKAKNVKGKCRVKLTPQKLYSICTHDRQTISINNMNVMAYGKEEWDTYSVESKIVWNDN